MTAESAASHARAERHPLGFNMGAIAIVAVLLGIALAYGIDAAARLAKNPLRGETQDAVLTRTLGGKDLAIPASWFRYAEQRVEGFAKQIDLRLLLPLGPDGAIRPVEVTLLPRSAVRPSAKVLDAVYLHMFKPDQLSGAPGLVGKPLVSGEGYDGETVWYDPLSGDPFVAKCGDSLAGSAASTCLRTVYLAPGIAAVYAFGPDVLVNWRKFDPTMRAMLAKIGVF